MRKPSKTPRKRRRSCLPRMAAAASLMASAAALSADASATATPAQTSAPSAPASKPVLAPGKTITWSFPRLPPTLREWVDGTKIIPKASVYLPADYTPRRKFPLAVFVGGAQGSTGEDANWAKDVFGDKGFICVGLPTFKESIEPLKEDKSNYWNRMMIMTGEGPFIWRSYKVIFEKIYSEIPNIDREQSVYGGFSNGAHTAAVLLSNPEEAKAFLGYFHRFVLVEGGHKLKPAADLTGCRFLLMRGGERKQDLFRNLKPQLDGGGVKWSEFVMPKVGHEYTPEGMAQTRKWVLQDP